MDDLISRHAAIDALEDAEDAFGYLTKDWREVLEQLPPIHHDNGLQKLADEIASFKRCFKSENCDYLTGYLSALSVVEGMIADMREVTT